MYDQVASFHHYRIERKRLHPFSLIWQRVKQRSTVGLMFIKYIKFRVKFASPSLNHVMIFKFNLNRNQTIAV